MSLASVFRRCGLATAAAGLVALSLVSGARAQSGAPIPGGFPAGVVPGQPMPMLPSAGLPGAPANGVTVDPGVAPGLPPAGVPVDPGVAPESPPAPQPTYAPAYATDRSVLDVVWASIFEDIYSPEAQKKWTPLPLLTFFSEGWHDPFVLPPLGDGGWCPTADGVGANRIGWIDAFGGSFFRAWFFEGFYANRLGNTNNNQYLQDFTIFVPFNRRFEIQFDTLFVVSNKGGKSGTYHTNWGDTTIHPRLMLQESKNLGQILEMGIQTPTGRLENGQGATRLFPLYSMWCNPIGKWSLRFSTGANIPVAKNGGYTTYYNLLGIGYYFPGKEENFFHNATAFLVAEDSAVITGTPRHENFFSLLPGFTTQIGKKLWFPYFGVQIPMTGPQAFTYQAIWAVVHAY
ncbi:MAG: hypothetical protein ACLP7Q_00180 [Isosphaeraceae bacterium]